MKYGNEFRSRTLALNPQFNYLPDGDRYLLALDQPRYAFNVIGAGIIGQEHIRVTHLEGRAAVYGLFDPNPRSIAAAQQLLQQVAPQQEVVVHESLEAACRDPEADALLICTPNYTHLEIVREAVKSGKPIFLEKPMATTLRDAYEIAQIARAYPAVFQIGLQYRYKAIYAEALYEALQRRAIGAIKTISILEHRIPFLDKVNQWNKFSQYSGGTLVEKCCHYFDLLNMFAQSRPARVFASGGRAVNFHQFEYEGQTSDILDSAFVTVVYANGVRAGFQLCMFAPMFYEELLVCGDCGRLKAAEQEDFLPGPRLTTELEILPGEQQPSRRATPNYPPHIQDSGHNGATFFEHRYFIDNLDGRETSTATADEGFWSIVVGAAAEESVKTGQVIEIADWLAAHQIADFT
jgi:myo-inositol 2-dehydrogenase / D-chiro-inositol 1-dehydrogenase